tara:strand:- start:1984 stop:3582 length:1599 start_codon:yes stop_codon:yes gene_type:complete
MHEHEFVGLRYSTSYPGGFDSCEFKLARSARYQYQDIFYFNRVTVYHGANKVVWDGEIRQIKQSQRGDEEWMVIGCLGHSAILSDAHYNRIWRDTRYTRWYRPDKASGPANSTPELFIGDNHSRLLLGARAGVSYSSTTEIGYWQFDEPFGDEIVEVTFTYEKNFAADWEARLVSASNQDFTADNQVEWTINAGSAATATVTQALTVDAASRRHIVFQLIYNAGAGAYAGADADTFLRITALTVKTDTGTLTANLIAQDVVAKYTDSKYGLSSAVTQLENVALDLGNIWTDDDKTGEDVMNLIVEYGEASGELVGWAVWEDKELVLETQPLSSIKYVVDAAEVGEIEIDGDIQGNYQRAYSVANDEDGWVIRGTTRDFFDDLSNDEVFGDRRRERPVDIPITTDEALEQTYVDLFLKRNALPAGRGRIRMRKGTLRNIWGAEVPLPQARADGLLQIQRFRAYEAEAAASATDLRDREFTEFVVHTEYDADSDVLTLSPGEVRPTLAQELNVLKKQIGPDAGWTIRHLGGPAR